MVYSDTRMQKFEKIIDFVEIIEYGKLPSSAVG